MRERGRFASALLALAAVAFSGAPAARAGGDESLRAAQQAVRDAARDTLDHPGDPARLVALGEGLFALARLPEAEGCFRRALAARADDPRALAGLGGVLLRRGHDAEAESLLARAGDAEGAARDLYVARLRRHEWAAAAPQAEAQGEPGRREMLERLATLPPPAAPAGPERAALPFVRGWPVPLVRVLLEGQSVLMAVDPGAPGLLLDPTSTHVAHVEIVPGERDVPWLGTHNVARNALVHRLGLGAFTLADVPAAVLPLHKYSLEVNSEGVGIAGVIGLDVLERFGVTLDVARQQLELRRPGVAAPAAHGAHVPFERWGESRLVVYGAIAAGRRLALQVGTGLPQAGLGATAELFDEAGLKPGRIANFVRGAGAFLNGRQWTEVGVPLLAVGGVAKDHVPAWSGAVDPDLVTSDGPRCDGLLGPLFFAGRRVTFDWERRELVFEDR